MLSDTLFIYLAVLLNYDALHPKFLRNTLLTIIVEYGLN